MIEVILPSSVVSADTFEDTLEGTLFPEEEEVIGRAVEKRRREFTTARLCARKALRELGRAPAPILPGRRGEPRWPAGIVGSITHCAGYRGAVVGEPSEVATVGIDAEPAEPLPDEVLRAIALPREGEETNTLLREHPDVRWDRLLFSAKEAVYKAWFPLTGRWLGFEDAMITMDPLGGTFHARLLVEGPRIGGLRLTDFSGRWLADRGLVLTAIVMPAPPPSP